MKWHFYWLLALTVETDAITYVSFHFTHTQIYIYSRYICISWVTQANWNKPNCVVILIQYYRHKLQTYPLANPLVFLSTNILRIIKQNKVSSVSSNDYKCLFLIARSISKLHGIKMVLIFKQIFLDAIISAFFYSFPSKCRFFWFWAFAAIFFLKFY